MTTISDIKADLTATRIAIHEGHETLTRPQLRELEDKVYALQKALSDKITEGAKPCPKCGNAPIGMEQPTQHGATEYLVGCVHCDLHEQPTGKTTLDGEPVIEYRHPHVRGGLLPRHAVEAWNEGIDFWAKVTKQEKVLAYQHRKAGRALKAQHDAKVAALNEPAVTMPVANQSDPFPEKKQ